MVTRSNGFSYSISNVTISNKIIKRVANKRVFKGDRWVKLYGSRIPIGSIVEVIKFYYRRRVLIKYNGEIILTLLWCLKKC